MKNFDISKVEQDAIKRFKNNEVLNTLPFSVESNVKWKNGDYPTEYDIIIYFNGIPYAVVEIKPSLSSKLYFEYARRSVDMAFKLIKISYAIITDNNDFYICDSKNTKNFQKLDFQSIISVIQNGVDIHIVENELLGREIENILTKYSMESFVNQLENTNGRYYFKEKAETEFWRALLEQTDYKVKKIYRYTTLDTVFFLLKNGTYRMNGIIGMNDKSEIDYFEGLILMIIALQVKISLHIKFLIICIYLLVVRYTMI